MTRSRCHQCGHPGRHRRVVTGAKKPCPCVCHRPTPARERHAWPSWVDDSIEFEQAS